MAILYLRDAYMNKIYHAYIFQGEKYLKNNEEYFEGWYFKNTNQEKTISFIPGISIHSEKKEAFVQIITKENSWYIPYDISEFSYTHEPFAIRIGDNYFSNEKIELAICHAEINLKGTLYFQDQIDITHSLLSPNIMGIFSFIPKMECNHAIISMKHFINGRIAINREILNFENGIGYIEKDWGYSFPSNYVWGQANCFSNQTASLFFAIANIPFYHFHFKGLICNFILEGKEYRFATYNGGKVVKSNLNQDNISIVLKKQNLTLEIIGKSNQAKVLKAPQNGKMKNHIQESIQAEISVILKQGNDIIYQDKSNCAGLEIVT